MRRAIPYRLLAAPCWIGTALFLLAALAVPGTAFAEHSPQPATVTVAGDLQSELGCPGDWLPGCADTYMSFDEDDQTWQAVFNVPAGNWQYKAALNDGWDENYGAGAVLNGANIGLSLGTARDVKFYYSHETHWVTDNVSSIIATAPGNYQDELGCASDWDPACLRSWLQDPDGDGIFTFEARLPAGDYEVKVAIDESWGENYGVGGVQNGPNIPFSVASDCEPTVFSWDSTTKVLSVSAGSGVPPQPASVAIPGNFQSELGCPGDWQPDCPVTDLAFDANDTVWQNTFNVPAGDWEYKAALDDTWDVNYGAGAVQNGPNVGLSLADPTAVKFYYDHGTHWVTDNVNSIIAVAPGNFQSELGCSSDWDPSCLRSWLQDPDGDGLYTFSTEGLAAGSYEAKVAIDESWDLNYGGGGAQNGSNIQFTVPRSCTPVFFTWDSDTKILTVGAENAPRGNLGRAQAYWLAEDLVAWRAADRQPLASWEVTLHYSSQGGLAIDPDGLGGPPGAGEIALALDPNGIPADVAAKFPHLSNLPAYRIAPAELSEVPTALKGQIAVAAVEDGTLIDATALQIPGVLDDLYAYDGELGAVFDGGTPTLKVWAPTAQSVRLHLFDDSDPATAATVLPMAADPATGVWSVTGDGSWQGKYYVYEVEVFVRSTGDVETNLVTDPYSHSLSINSARTQIVDLSDPALKPAGWDGTAKPPLAAPEDIVLWELHVRDFSAQDPDVPEPVKGTFKAFTVDDSHGRDHLEGLADAGLTHVHLLPAFDIATIDEDRSTWLDPPGDLSLYGPASEEQQAAVLSVADQDGFNWGYDPWHYTVPEGSYSTDPDGPTRIVEFREMVQELNQLGLRVVMDVVYNHTNASGQNPKSVLDRIVPGYYHRLNQDGEVERSTCCDNTATEHAMMEKLMIDSVVTWTKEYKVDGFRFDLMGHHMKRNMLALREALDALTLEDDGIDGSRVYVYGEGWNFGEVANNARGVNATQLDMAGTGIGSFSDRLRDAARGGGPFSGIQEQGFLNGLWVDPNGVTQGSPQEQLDRLLLHMDQIRVGLAGNLADYTFTDRFGNTVTGAQIDYNGQPAGYTEDPQEVITYVAAHDNETLFDAIQFKAPAGATMAERVRMQNLGLSLVTFGQGIPFWHAGMDMLRSKSLDRNSYNSGDWFNKLDFTYATNNWGVGLPPETDNGDNWPVMAPLLADPALAPSSGDVTSVVAHSREVLGIRSSTPLFRLRTAQDVLDRVRYHNTGSGQVPGLIVMSVSDDEGAIDRGYEHLAVVFNADVVPVSFAAPALAGLPFELHPVFAASADPVVQSAGFAEATGTFSVPALTAAVYWAERPAAEQIELLIADVRALVDAGVLNGGQGNALTVKLEGALAKVESGQLTPAIHKLGAFVHQVEAFVAAGVLTAEEGQALLDAAQVLLGQLTD